MGINEYLKIGSKMKEYRINAGISQRNMAEKLNLSYSTYSNYENNYREPKLEVIKDFCILLDLDIIDLIDSDGLHPIDYLSIISKYDNCSNQESFPFNVNEYTKEEIKEIKQFAEFVKNKRNTE